MADRWKQGEEADGEGSPSWILDGLDEHPLPGFERTRRLLLQGLAALLALGGCTSSGVVMERKDFSPVPGPARIPPITPEEWTDEVRAFFDFVEGPKGRQNGSKLNIILTLA